MRAEAASMVGVVEGVSMAEEEGVSTAEEEDFPARVAEAVSILLRRSTEADSDRGHIHRRLLGLGRLIPGLVRRCALEAVYLSGLETGLRGPA